MGAVSKTVSSSQAVKWMWKANDDPWDTTQAPEWRRYSDVENMTIEKAYQAKETGAMLDDYHLDFSHMVQISNNGIHKQRPVKRMPNNLESSDDVFQKRFLPNLTVIKASAVSRPGAFGDFIWEAYLLGQWRDVSQDILVERAAQGIIIQGTKLGKRSEAEQMAKHLLKVKHGTRKQIWQSCTYLYSSNNFLYQRLTETLRLVNSEEYKQEWKSRLLTLGLFAWFLFDFPLDTDEFEGYVYTALKLDTEDIDQYKTAAKTGELLALPEFIETTRKRSAAEEFGNDLFIISIVRSRETSVDITAISKYPQEEQRILIPGFLFRVTRVEFDIKNNKHLIYLQDCNNE